MSVLELESLLKSLGLRNVIIRNENVMACCPADGHRENRPSWGVSVHPPYKHGCLACGFRGTLLHLLRYTYGWSDSRIQRVLAEGMVPSQQQSLTMDSVPEPELQVSDESLLFSFDEVVHSPKAMSYLNHRGISFTVIRRARLRWDKEQQRIICPWYLDGQLTAVTGCSVDPKNKVKVLPYFDSRKSQRFYFPYGVYRGGRVMKLVEGEIDALHCCSCSRSTVAALGFGTITAGAIKHILANPPRELVAFFDDDETGERLTQLLYQLVGGLLKVTRANYSRVQRGPASVGVKLDPAELSSDEMACVLDGRKSYANWPEF